MISASRGLVYESELNIILDWMTNKKIGKDKNKASYQVKTDLPKHIIAQVLVDLLKRPDVPPFTLTPSEICSSLSPFYMCFYYLFCFFLPFFPPLISCLEINGSALDSFLKLAKERKVKIYDEIK